MTTIFERAFRSLFPMTRTREDNRYDFDELVFRSLMSSVMSNKYNGSAKLHDTTFGELSEDQKKSYNKVVSMIEHKIDLLDLMGVALNASFHVVTHGEAIGYHYVTLGVRLSNITRNQEEKWSHIEYFYLTPPPPE
jgi:hypothetical protein